MENSAILHDFYSGRISGAGPVERVGIELMRAAAYVLAPVQFAGFSWVARAVSALFRSNRPVHVKFADDCVFEYPYGDGYWGVLLYNKLTYAPDVELYLKSFADIDYAFIDCGSNYGYMSVLVSSADYGSKPAMAIEADPENYQLTVRNSQLNTNRYDHAHNAIFKESGKKVTLFGTKHEAISMLEELSDDVRAQVKTLALNDLMGWLEKKGNPATILKLDVEGVEIDALAGADKILAGNCLINYEEHGADKTHEISRHLKDNLNMRLFIGDNQGEHMREILDWQQLDKIKSNPRWGYDLFATTSEFWLARLEAMTPQLSDPQS